MDERDSMQHRGSRGRGRQPPRLIGVLMPYGELRRRIAAEVFEPGSFVLGRGPNGVVLNRHAPKARLTNPPLHSRQRSRRQA